MPVGVAAGVAGQEPRHVGGDVRGVGEADIIVIIINIRDNIIMSTCLGAWGRGAAVRTRASPPSAAARPDQSPWRPRRCPRRSS